ncbi:MAG TPA: hypothetical protein VFI91_02625 [Longimicrobiaceae bacterium]|nr:hypothetical protein [Longimicrobiaceae bacterium]
MKQLRVIGTVLIGVGMSTLVVACGGAEDTDARAALEREALQREIDIALQPDTTIQPEFADVALEEPEAEPTAPAASSTPPARTRQPEPQPAPRRPEPAPTPRPSPEPSRPRVVTIPVPSGTTMALRMDRELSTESSSAGTTFTATVTDAIRAADGTTLIPAGAKVHGRVASAGESSRAGESANIELAFNSVSFGGESYSLAATAVDVPVRKITRDSNTEKAAKIGGGAALGAILGQVIGKDAESTIAGAAIGAAAGTAVVMGTADVDAVVPEGARVVIRLDRSIPVRKTVG